MLYPSTSRGTELTIIPDSLQILWNTDGRWSILEFVEGDHQDAGQTGKPWLFKLRWITYQLTTESPRAICSSHLWPSGCLPSNRGHLSGRRPTFADLWGATLPHPSGWGPQARFSVSPRAALSWIWGKFSLGRHDIIHQASPIPTAWIYRGALHKSCWEYHWSYIPTVGLPFQIQLFMLWLMPLFKPL